jgi:PRTRC genetic system protein B
MNDSDILFEEPTTVTTDFALIGKSCGERKFLELHNITNGNIGAQIPFSKKTAQRIFSLFDSEKYVSKSFKSFIPDNVILAKDNPTDGLHLIWSVKSTVRTLYFSNSSSIETGLYPIPNLIFRYYKNVLQVLATNARTIDMNTVLFHAPFFNVYISGNICMGNVNVRGIERFESFDTTLEYLENAFFNSVFTHSNNPIFDAESIKKTFGEKAYKKQLFPIYNSRTDKQMTINDLL